MGCREPEENPREGDRDRADEHGRRDESVRHRLTPQELQIALALAQGRTTREAAAKLFLSPKTVEYHLRNVYDKFEVRSREALRQIMAGTGAARIPVARSTDIRTVSPPPPPTTPPPPRPGSDAAPQAPRSPARPPT